MAPDIFVANTDEEIQSCFPAFSALRPHVKEEGFLPQVRRQQQQSYQIVALRQGGVVESAAGFRFAEYLAWTRCFVDDLTTLPSELSQGFAGALMDWLIAYASSNQCRGVHLDSGYARHAAHRLYLRKGLQLHSHHFALEFSNV